MAPRMAAVLHAPGKLCSFSYVLFVFVLFYVLDVVSITVYRACERSGAWSERGAERAKYSRSVERVFIQRLERSLCLSGSAPIPLTPRA